VTLVDREQDSHALLSALTPWEPTPRAENVLYPSVASVQYIAASRLRHQRRYALCFRPVLEHPLQPRWGGVKGMHDTIAEAAVFERSMSCHPKAREQQCFGTVESLKCGRARQAVTWCSGEKRPWPPCHRASLLTLREILGAPRVTQHQPLQLSCSVLAAI